jgi:AcrR family transcriptional regulator
MVEFPLPSSGPASDADDVRERLFAVAMSHFRTHGYAESPVSRITLEAGVAKGTFFNHFPRKEHVLAEAFHRVVNEVVGEVEGEGSSGTDAIMSFVRTLGTRLGGDRPLAEALLPRLALLPPPSAEGPREGARIRTWIEHRLGEALPVAVPVEEISNDALAFLVASSLRGTLDEWGRPDGPVEPLDGLLADRTRFLLRAAGLPAD